MRDLFSEYYRLTQGEFDFLWSECVFCFDANVLLDVYRYTPDTRNRLLAVLEKLQERIWIPYQVAKEFHENRIKVIRDQEVPYEKISSKVQKAITGLTNELQALSLEGRKPHPFINMQQVYAVLDGVLGQVEDVLQKSKEAHPDLLEDDPLLLRIAELFDGKVGDAYDPEALNAKYQEIKIRYSHEIPPGYKDLEAKEPPAEGGTDSRAYGDAVCWFQMLDFAKQERKPIVFVTGDVKEDWWLKIYGKTIGPRPELIREMRKEAEVNYYQYVTDVFLERAEAHLNIESKPQAVDEIRDLRRQDELSAFQAYLRAKNLMELAKIQAELEERLSDTSLRLQSLEDAVGDSRRYVTLDQASQISQGVKLVAMKLGKKTGRNEYGSVYGELYRKFGITSYKQLPAAKFDEAMTWLNDWQESIDGDMPF